MAVPTTITQAKKRGDSAAQTYLKADSLIDKNNEDNSISKNRVTTNNVNRLTGGVKASDIM